MPWDIGANILFLGHIPKWLYPILVKWVLSATTHCDEYLLWQHLCCQSIAASR